MANWSETYIVYTADNILHLAQIADKLSQYYNEPADWITDGTYGMEVTDYQLDTDSLELCIIGAGRWSSPDDLFCLIAVDTKCSLEYHDLESGSDFHTYYEYRKGELVNHQVDDYLSQLTIDYNGVDWFTDELHCRLEDCKSLDSIEDHLGSDTYNRALANGINLEELINDIST